MSKKKTLGELFRSEFADMRLPWEFLTRKIEDWLIKYKIEHTINQFGGLLIGEDFYESTFSSNFWGDYKGCYININQSVKSDLCLIGKGVAFDTGGWNMKGSQHMAKMHFDKSGAILALAYGIDHKLPVKTFFTDNVLRVYPDSIVEEPITGTKVFIGNTDAEGRIGLADLLAQTAKECKYSKVITMATLTGAAVAATGEGTFALVHGLTAEGVYSLAKSYDKGVKLWAMPENKKYDELIKTKIKGADITNNPGGIGGGGSQTAFSFLKHFAGGLELIHMDMAAMDSGKEGNADLTFGFKELDTLVELIK